jgi:ATP-dependent Clp protease ATP-binding subunit ClpA
LLDEIEKAHPDIFNILLQILDEGELTDSSGITVSFRDTIIIIASNAGNSNSDTVGALGFGKVSESDYNREKINDSLKRIFSPELLNRIDEIVYFNRLTLENFYSIAELMIGEVVEKLKDEDITLVLPDKVKKHIAEMSFEPKIGARNLRRIIQREVEDKIAEIILKEDSNSGSEDDSQGELIVTAHLKDGYINYKTRRKKEKSKLKATVSKS